MAARAIFEWGAQEETGVRLTDADRVSDSRSIRLTKTTGARVALRCERRLIAPREPSIPWQHIAS
jgi:uncharacterized protein (UPF0548 family)